ncbi:hypothetical protein HS1genome_1238 [Sulfodiicoccus acidiphilus]|uniref:Electron transfer flavoprotein alpha/beta-subunit N-terminal domain-containing protein n=1 Tax=Sulfodiicoccus acidiphilus TaxID=1670455 RepID=A0A348B3U7_9CREN|nr:hypothetical protein [Sulfodiicoccus acidiphilus]BBD72849.1 hypothetical protein HS1genome_1238 [Sulfodiicoccus acidiphilus]GGT88504.1 hypothetical protein GCM10007116_03130 [Sulfodiicoccus acidiphilus]
MLVFALVKGVPANTANVVSVGGILRREQMDIVMNPYDRKTIEAADYMKRQAGGKLVAVSMGPHVKIIPIMQKLFDAEVSGIDEAYILSDRKFAGADTLATSYTLAIGVKKVLDLHVQALDKLIEASHSSTEEFEKVARDLYYSNMVPNYVYSDKPAVKDSLVQRLREGKVSKSDLEQELTQLRESVYRDFVVFAGMKASDGETWNTGPQAAEALSEMLNVTIPHASSALGFEYYQGSLIVRRRIGQFLQTVRMELPAIITINPDYYVAPLTLEMRRQARAMTYMGKRKDPVVWTAAEVNPDPTRIGLAGSPTVVGPGVDIGRPPQLKIVGKSTVLTEDVDKFEVDGKSYGPFKKGDPVDSLPENVKTKLAGKLKVFEYDDLVDELLRELK